MSTAKVTSRFYQELWPHRAAVLRLAQFLTRDAADADDLAQEVMLKGFRRLDQLHPGSDARAWLMTILRHTRIDRARANAAHQHEISLDHLAAEPAAAAEPASDGHWHEPETLLEEFSDRQIIAALKALPEEIRWTLMLVDIEGMEQSEAAQVLDVPVGTVKSRAHRGRAMLRQALTPVARELRLIR